MAPSRRLGDRGDGRARYKLTYSVPEHAPAENILRRTPDSRGRTKFGEDKRMLTWAHFGDLHVSEEDGWRSLAALRNLVSEANRRLDDDIDFVFLPGDNANHGTVEQYARIAAVLAELKPQ